jgi:hypothetical protein
MPALHRQHLECCQESGVESVEIISGDARRSIKILFELKVSSKYLHPQQREDKYEQQQ